MRVCAAASKRAASASSSEWLVLQLSLWEWLPYCLLISLRSSKPYLRAATCIFEFNSILFVSTLFLLCQRILIISILIDNPQRDGVCIYTKHQCCCYSRCWYSCWRYCAVDNQITDRALNHTPLESIFYTSQSSLEMKNLLSFCAMHFHPNFRFYQMYFKIRPY